MPTLPSDDEAELVDALDHLPRNSVDAVRAVVKILVAAATISEFVRTARVQRPARDSYGIGRGSCISSEVADGEPTPVRGRRAEERSIEHRTLQIDVDTALPGVPDAPVQLHGLTCDVDSHATRI
jgi:hypothetical protein